MDLRILFASALVLVIGISNASEPTYVITAPRQVHPLSPYTVLVSLHNSDTPLEVKVNLTGTNEQNAHNVVTVNPGESKEIKLQIGDWKGADILVIEGSGAAEFSTTQSVTFNPKKNSIFIQTDKAIYQPGQKVQFRVFVVDNELRPYKSEISVHIYDPQSNLIKQYLNNTLEKGVFTGELQLSDRPLLGKWSIQTYLGQVRKDKSFSIEEYVLPTYEVIVTPPPYTTYSETEALIRVEAKYTFGKPVRGEVQLNVTDICQRYGYFNECRARPNITTQLDKNGVVVIPLDITGIRYPQYYYYSDSQISIKVVVTETHTQKTMEGTAELTIYPHAEKLSMSSSPDKFRPGLPIQLITTLSGQDNKPIIRPDATINFTITYQTNSKPIDLNFIRKVPENGVIMEDLIPPAEATTISVRATFKEGVTTYLSINTAPTLGKKYILAELVQKDQLLKVGEFATFTVDSTFLHEQFTYEIISGGDIVDGVTRRFPKTKSSGIHLQLTHAMAPRSRFIVYVITSCGEILSDSIDFQVDGFFLTPVRLNVNATVTEPGRTVELAVQTNPSAVVYLLGIDQSVLLLRSGNDITRKEVEQDFAEYDSSNAPSYRGDGPVQLRYIWRPTTDGIEQTFQAAGLIFYTNALYQKESCGPIYPGRWYGEMPMPLAESMVPMRAFNVNFDAGAPRQVQSLDNIKVRKNFPETWIWNSISAGNNGTAIFQTAIPDRITSWVISAVAMHDNTGLSLPDSPTKVTVFQNLFVTLNLPYSVIRGETLNLQVLVFNYMKTDVEGVVSLSNEHGEFDFTTEPINDQIRRDPIKVGAQQTVSAIFPITLKKVGYVKISVTVMAASNSLMTGDSVQRMLLVKPEGTTKYFNKAILLDLRQKRKLLNEVEIKVPEDIVPDSEHVEVSVIGDIMGPTVKNIDKLLRVPSGCGEQNMINLVPNIVVANYLTEIGQFTPERRKGAVSNIETGYQRQLNYKRNDGSFSAFGNSDVNGSTWLTAYVLKSFAQAKPFIPINDEILESGLDFLNRTQAADGTFVENGRIIHKAMQGGSEKSGLSMTAYITIAFLEIEKPKYKATVTAALKALERRLPDVVDPYETAIITYALHKGNSPAKDTAFKRLRNHATKEGDLIYWKKRSDGSVPTARTYDTDSISSVNVEATAYALLTYATRKLSSQSIPLVRWLIGQRSENGGFASTQDTVIGLEALSSTGGQLVSTANSKVDVDFKYGGKTTKFSVTKDNSLVLQQDKLPSDTQLVEITASGNGVCIAQVTWSYNVINLALSGTFEITVKVDSKTGDSYKLTACAKYTDKDGEASNMAIIQLNSLSGYSFDKQNEPRGVKRVEYEFGNTRMNLYYDEIDGNETCVTATVIINNEVANLQEADVVVYDYYQPNKKATTRYKI